jgi:hypothetical protein
MGAKSSALGAVTVGAAEMSRVGPAPPLAEKTDNGSDEGV